MSAKKRKQKPARKRPAKQRDAIDHRTGLRWSHINEMLRLK